MDLMSGLSSAASSMMSLANNIQASNLNKSNRSFADDQRRQQNEFAREMWNATNEYNSPRAQLQRLQEAGINPNTAISSSVANPVTSAGTNSSVSSVFSPLTDAVNPIMQQLAYQSAKEDVLSKKIANDNMSESLRLDNATKQLALNRMTQEIIGMKKTADLTDAQIQQITAMLPNLLSKSKSEIELLQQNLKNESASYDNLRQQLSNLRKEGSNIEQDTRYKSLVNDLQASKNRLLQHLYDIGIDPESHGADRFLEFVLDNDNVRNDLYNVINKVLDYFGGDVKPQTTLRGIVSRRVGSLLNNKFSKSAGVR